MARWLGDHDFKAVAHLRQHLYGPRTPAKNATAKPSISKLPPTVTKPVTFAELEAKLAKLEAETHARAVAARIVTQQTAERVEQRERIQLAFGTSPQRRGCTFDGVVQKFQ